MRFLKFYRKKIFTKNYSNKIILSHLQFLCIFLGHDRSGSTLVASILNAHPHVIISIEENILKLVLKDFTKEQIFNLIENNSKKFIYSLKNTWTGYNYNIPGISYNKNKIIIIGDKKAGVTSKLVGKYDFLLPKLEKLILLPIKIIIVIRNPFDTISSLTKNDKKIHLRSIKNILNKRIDQYFHYTEVIDNVLKNTTYDSLIVFHEKLIQNPKNEIRKIFNFLTLDANDQFIERASKLIYKTPHVSRYDIQWDKGSILEVEKKIQFFSFINHYKYE